MLSMVVVAAVPTPTAAGHLPTAGYAIHRAKPKVAGRATRLAGVHPNGPVRLG